MNNDVNDKRIDDYEQGVEEGQKTASSGSSRHKKVRVKKKRKKKYYSLRILVLILLCVLTYFVLHSDAFLVKEIQVEENDRFSVERIKEITGLKKGVNIFEIEKKDCEKKLEENPYIRDAEISRNLPGTVRVSLDLRTPVAVIMQKDKYIMIDREGVVLEKRDKLPHYTVLDGITPEEVKAGQVITVKEEKKYQQYMELLDKISAADLYFRKIVIEDNSVKLYAKKNLYCMGEKDNIVEGIEDGNLKAVLYRLVEKDIKKGVVTVGDDKYYSFTKSVK